MDKIYDLAIAYPDFQLNQIIDPDQIDLNNSQLVSKINQLIKYINTFTQSTTGGAEITIAELTEFPSAQNVQAALSQIATYTKEKNAEQDGEIETVKQRLSNTESKNVEQNNALLAHETRVKNLELNTYEKSNIDAKFAKHETTAHDDKYYRKNEVYTKQELSPFIKSGDTNIMYEVYTIINPLIVSETGKKTFSYRDNSNNIYTGDVLDDSTQVFDLRKGYVTTGLNRVEITINDTLKRSVASGGLREISETKIGLTSPEGAGAEVTIKYYERIDLQGQYQICVNREEPPFKTNTLWFKVL